MDDFKLTSKEIESRLKAIRATRSHLKEATTGYPLAIGGGIDYTVFDAPSEPSQVVKSTRVMPNVENMKDIDYSEDGGSSRTSTNRAKKRLLSEEILGNKAAPSTMVETSKTHYLTQDKADKTMRSFLKDNKEVYKDINVEDVSEFGEYKNPSISVQDSHADNIAQYGDDWKYIDTGEFNAVTDMDGDLAENLKKKRKSIGKRIINKNTAGKFRRVLPMIPAVGVAASLFSDDASAAIDPMGSTVMDTPLEETPAYHDAQHKVFVNVRKRRADMARKKRKALTDVTLKN